MVSAGSFTAFFAATSALAQNDIKKVIALAYAHVLPSRHSSATLLGPLAWRYGVSHSSTLPVAAVKAPAYANQELQLRWPTPCSSS